MMIYGAPKFHLFKNSLYDYYWRFACERQTAFFKRNILHQSAPWTNDTILQKYKFTNVYRVNDRVTQFLIGHILYGDDCKNYDEEDTVLRVLLFKIFNKIETWEKIEQDIGNVYMRKGILEDVSCVLKELVERQVKIYSNAYIMPSGVSVWGHRKKYLNHLQLLKMMLKDNIVYKIMACRNMKTLYNLLLRYPTIGSFLAYQYATDLNYSEIVNFSEMEFVIPGPGAISGLNKCFQGISRDYYPQIIYWMAEHQEMEFTRLGLNFRKLGNRPLQLIDCQNIFCEFDKYSRVAFPEYNKNSGRTRIKMHFHENRTPIHFCYPPKWGICL